MSSNKGKREDEEYSSRDEESASLYLVFMCCTCNTVSVYRSVYRS